MKKNVAAQTVGAQLISKTDGSAVTTGTTSVYYTGDNGVQSINSPGVATHKGNGYWEYSPDQSETNFDHVAFTFVNSSAVNVSVQIWTSFPQTGDNFTRIGAPVGASISADVAATKALLPTALATDGSMRASVQSFLGTAFTEGAGGRIAAAFKQFFNIAAPAATMDHGVLVDTVTTVGSVTGFTASDVGAIKTVTDKLGDTFEADSSPANYRFTAHALANAPSGGTAPTVTQIADEVQTRTIAAVTTVGAVSGNVAGSVGSLAAQAKTDVRAAVGLATANLDTQLASAAGTRLVEGSYTHDGLLRLISAVQLGKTTIGQTSPSGAVVTFRDVNDTVDRAVYEVSSNPAERLSSTLTP